MKDMTQENEFKVATMREWYCVMITLAISTVRQCLPEESHDRSGDTANPRQPIARLPLRGHPSRPRHDFRGDLKGGPAAEQTVDAPRGAPPLQPRPYGDGAVREKEEATGSAVYISGDHF